MTDKAAKFFDEWKRTAFDFDVHPEMEVARLDDALGILKMEAEERGISWDELQATLGNLRLVVMEAIRDAPPSTGEEE